MKRGKKLMLLLAVLIVLIAAVLVVLHLDLEGTDTEEEDTGVSVFTLDPEAATGLTWTYEDETLTFIKADGVWTYAEDSAFPLEESYLTAMLTVLSDVIAGKTIASPEDLAQYGLEEPACTVTVTADTETELRIGNETGIGGERYLSVGDGNVYLVDEGILDSFSYGLLDLVAKEAIPDMTDVTGLEVVSEVQSYTLSYVAADAEEDSEDDSEEEVPVWFWNGDSELPLDTTLTEALVKAVTGMNWGACVDYAAADSLADYGLDAPTLTVTVNYTETEDGETSASFVLEIGDYVDGSCYARIAGSDLVYWIDGSIGDSLMSAVYDDLSPEAAQAEE